MIHKKAVNHFSFFTFGSFLLILHHYDLFHVNKHFIMGNKKWKKKKNIVRFWFLFFFPLTLPTIWNRNTIIPRKVRLFVSTNDMKVVFFMLISNAVFHFFSFCFSSWWMTAGIEWTRAGRERSRERKNENGISYFRWSFLQHDHFNKFTEIIVDINVFNFLQFQFSCFLFFFFLAHSLFN